MNIMKKSILTFGLLMSSLVMLSAMPLLNNNNGVMAQEYYDDNSYYSQYPTDDKKYECRTGPFEGFFVGSVEFCKHDKFDKDKDRKDIRDNRTGTQGQPGPSGATGATGAMGSTGPPGPAGPQGIQGIQGIQGLPGANGTQGDRGPQGIQGPIGPQGITFLNATNLYRVTGPLDQSISTTDTSITSVARCDSGDSPVNGASLIVIDEDARLVFTGTSSGGDLSNSILPSSYVTLVNDANPGNQVQSFVTCFDNPPLRP
jgi:hypothetical protein